MKYYEIGTNYQELTLLYHHASEIGISQKKLFKFLYERVRNPDVGYAAISEYAFFFSKRFSVQDVLDILNAAEEAQEHNNKPLDTPISVRLGLYKGLKQRSENMNNW